MPRIFELRSCLQEVQDSLFGLDQQNRKSHDPHDHHSKSDSNWLEDSFNLGSESEIINIPGKTFFLNYVIKNVGVCFVKVLLDFLPTVALKIVSWWALKMVGCRP